jgi:Glycine zipper 2TM domain
LLGNGCNSKCGRIKEIEMTRQAFIAHPFRHALAAVALFALAACVTEPPRQIAVAAPPPAPDTSVYFYPAQGRAITAEQQDRDRYECNAWAVQGTGFDPSLPTTPSQQRVRVVAGGPPPGTGIAVGALSGAIVGSAVSSPWHSGRGALFGAIAGATIGGIADAGRAADTNRMQAQADANANSAQNAALDRQANEYRRAMGACLEGRGYAVR